MVEVFAMLAQLRRNQERFAFSLVEMLVVIGVIAILLALLLPAVQYAREAARKMACLNHLKQIALATHGYEATHGCFPPFQLAHDPPLSDGGLYWSTYVLLLPYLERAPLYDRILREGDPVWVQRVGIPTFRCPSESRGGGPATVSYARCIGSDQSDRRGTGIYAPAVFAQSIQVSDVPDGLSNTALFGEILRGSNTQLGDPRRPVWGITSRPVPGEGAAYAAKCRRLPAPTTGIRSGRRGIGWWGNYGWNSVYNHILPPNTRSCSWDQGDNRQGTRFGSFNAASNHAGGVHFSLADGSVQFASNNIALGVWRAIGTRRGGEVVTTF